MKKFLVSMLVLAMATTLVGCGGDKPADPGTTTPNTTTPVTSKVDYPTKPVEIWVPYGPGGQTDIVARLLTKVLPKYLPENKGFIVVNKPGASTTLAGGEAVNKPADGYTLLISTPNTVSTSMYSTEGVQYKAEDFELLMQLVNMPMFINVPKSSTTLDTPEKWLAAMKEKELKYGMMGTGNITHIMFNNMNVAGYKCKPVPFKSYAECGTALMQGVVDFVVGGVDRSIDSKQICTVQSVPASNLPDLPTLAEITGQPTWYSDSGIIMFAKAGMPEDLKNVIVDAFKQAIADPELKPALDELEVFLAYQDAATLTKAIEAQRIFALAGLKDLGMLVNDPNAAAK